MNSFGLLIIALTIGGVFLARLEDDLISYRLPTDFLPESYTIELTTYLDENGIEDKKKFTFEGKVSIIVEAQIVTTEIVLHAKSLNITHQTVTTVDEKKEFKILEVNRNETVDKYSIVLDNFLVVREKYNLTFFYNGALSDDMLGFYKSSYNDKGTEKWLAATQFEFTHARKVFPCFDEPKFKATFQVTINCHKDFTAISNTASIGRKEIGNRVIETFTQTPKMSTYTLAFLISNFKESKSEYKDFSVVGRPDASEQTKYSLEIGPKILEELNAFTNLTYNKLGISKIHMAAIPDFSYGAMENWGLITYKERSLLYDSKHTTHSLQQNIATVIAHELAHMWFGNLVTCEWWSYAWLNEGFATFFEYFITNQIHSDWELDKQFVTALHSVFYIDSFNTSDPLTKNEDSVETYSEISQRFDKISYYKGAAIIRMIQDTMGNEKFKTALQKYLEAKKFDTAKPDELFNYLIAEWTGIDIKIFLEDWTKQSGYPLVTITLSDDRKKLSVNQKRFFLTPNENDDKELYTIPFTYSLENDFTNIKKKMLAKTKDNIVIDLGKPIDWVIGNINQIGYYRVNYDEKTWYNIHRALMSKEWSGISEINRAQIVDDLMNLGRSGQLRYGLVLNILDYLKTETNFLPWTAAFNGFSFITNKMTPSERQIFSKYVLKLLDKVYNQLGFNETKNDSRLDIYVREKVLMWACKYGHKECISSSREYFSKMRKNLEVPLNIRAPVYCTIIREGGRTEYEYFINKYQKSNEATEKFLILKSLSCTDNDEIIKVYYNYILTNNVRKQDKKIILSTLYTENPLQVFNLIADDYKKINTSFGGGDNDVANIVAGIAKYFSTETEKELYTKFINKFEKQLSSSAVNIIKNGIISIDSNVKFTKTNIRTYLNHLKFKLTNTDGYRLPTDILPIKYDIKLTPYILENEGELGHDRFTFDGEVTITLKTNKSDINEIVLHAKNLDIKKITLNGTEFTTIPKPDKITDKLVLTLNASLTENDIHTLKFIYIGKMDDDMHGFYKSTYKDKDGNDKWLASTQFQPVHARRAFPCFDEPKFKAVFKVSISRHNSLNSTSNMQKEKTLRQGDRVLDIFTETPIMSTYILAFMVSDFKERFIEGKEDFLVIAREDAFNQTEYSFDIGQQILVKLNEYTGLEYKSLGNPKMHMAAIPDFSAGAMENWGLLTYRERALLYDANETTASAQQSIAAVIAHEQAHMWFGDYVTCDWWGYTWLNEGFARYFQYVTTDAVTDGWELDKQFVVDQIHSVMKMDSLNNTHPMSDKTIESPADISKMFGSISYNKGASIIRMINNTMNVKDDKFRSAIQKYLKALKYNNSVPEDLFKYLEAEWDTTEINKTEFFNDWTTQVGYPLVTFTLSDDKKSINVTQKRFLLKSGAGDANLTYTVPITFTTSKEKNFNDIVTKFLTKSTKSMVIPLKDKVDWIIGNVRQVGYYRVNYDNKTWHSIHGALYGKEWSGIHEINRAQIVDDLMNLGQSDVLDYALVLNILEYLETELHYLPWTAAFNGFSTIAARFGSDDIVFRQYILYLLNKVYNKLGFNETKNDSRLDIYNRPKVLSWACKYGHKKCIESSKKLFDSLKENKTVPVNIRSAVYCSAIREGKIEDYNDLVKKYENSSVATEQVLILGALGCAKEKETVEKYYNYILSEKVRRQDKSSSLSSLISQNAGNPEIVFKLIVNSFKKLGEALADEDRDIAAANIMSSAANYFTSQTQIDELDKFHKDNSDKINKKALETLAKASKASKENIEWSEKHLPEYKKRLEAYIKKKRNGASSGKSLSMVLVSVISVIFILLNYCN